MKRGSTSPINGTLLGLLYLSELAALLAVFTLYRSAGKPDLLSFVVSRPGILFLTASLVCVLSVVGIIQQLLKGRQTKSGQIIPTLATNLVPLLTVLTLAELTARLCVSITPAGPAFGSIPLRPRMWEEIAAHYSEIAKRRSEYDTFFVYDDLLGWTNGPSRRSEDGLFLSSVEGLRSPKAGMTYAERPTACRIALLGDSFTFGWETPFEESWGHQLELGLPMGCQVLNFAVPWFGIGQMYLRYARDVRPWQPDIVVLAFTNGAEARTMGVYGFLTHATSDLPWAQPHFVLKDKGVEIVNLPLPPAERIFSLPSITDLPYIEYDWHFHPREWDLTRWRYFYSSYLFRFFISWYPLHEIDRPENSKETLNSVNLELFRAFVQLTSSSGSIPIVVYLPGERDYPYPRSWDPVGLKILRDAGIEYTDLTSCLNVLHPSERFLRSGNSPHYSTKGEATIAQCVQGIVNKHLLERKKDKQRKTYPNQGAKSIM